MDSLEVYSRSYGMIYLCRPCQAWVGVHRGTDKALGRLANAELREWKKNAHAAFDPIWKEAVKRGAGKVEARKNAYSWLTEQFGTTYQIHIGHSDVDDCKKIVAHCELFISNGNSIPFTKKRKLVFPSGIEGMPPDDFADLKNWCYDNEVNCYILQPTQYRFSNNEQVLDIYPKNRKYHDITLNLRGWYDDLPDVLAYYFPDDAR